MQLATKPNNNNNNKNMHHWHEEDTVVNTALTTHHDTCWELQTATRVGNYKQRHVLGMTNNDHAGGQRKHDTIQFTFISKCRYSRTRNV